MDYMQPDEETYRAVELASLCKELKALPGPGGLYDQDWYHVYLLKGGLAGMHAKEERELEKAKSEAKRH